METGRHCLNNPQAERAVVARAMTENRSNEMKPKLTAGLLCVFAMSFFVFTRSAHAALPVYTQQCPNGDRIAVDMNKKTLALTRGTTTWNATYDDSFAYKWSPNNPPPPAGAKSFATQGSVAADGAFFGDGDMDSNTVCPRIH
jgi:hypothetical protein